eukprot:5372610-Heterocapsa_arctica.AAC.1
MASRSARRNGQAGQQGEGSPAQAPAPGQSQVLATSSGCHRSGLAHRDRVGRARSRDQGLVEEC